MALSNLTMLARHSDGTRVLGVIAFSMIADPALYRLLPEASKRLQMEITSRIASILRPKDQLYSINHWEWLIVLPELLSTGPLSMAMMRLEQSLENPPLFLNGMRMDLTPSCGAAIHPDHGQDALHLVQSARIARLYADRKNGGSMLYDASMEHLDDSQRNLDADLLNALKSDGGLALYLQPQIDLRTNRCTGAEALLRWQRKPGEFVPPPNILASIERQGLSLPFNRWLIQQASQMCAQLLDQNLDIVLSINLSANDLLEPDLPDMITVALATWDVPTHRLLAEITETTMVEQTGQVMEVLHRLRKSGITLSIDDFGTGFSGMTYLKTLPVQEVKIDQIFVRNIVNSPKDQEIVEATIQLAHRLKMEVIAEGVEDEAARDLLARLGSDRAQGFHYSKALPLADFVQWVRRHHGEA